MIYVAGMFTCAKRGYLFWSCWFVCPSVSSIAYTVVNGFAWGVSGQGTIHKILGMIGITSRIQDQDYDPYTELFLRICLSGQGTIL